MSETVTHEGKPNVPPQLFIEKELKFSFRKPKGADDELGAEKKRPPITFTGVKIPTIAGIVDYLYNDSQPEKSQKVAQFIVDLVEDAIKDQIRSQLTDGDKPVMAPEQLDHSKLDLFAIASMPKSERTGGGISKEVWEEFEKDYIAVMGPIRESDEKAAKAAKLMVGRFNNCRTDKPVLTFLREQLGIWFTNTQNAEDFAEVYNYLDERAGTLLNRDSEAVLSAL